MVEYGSIKTLFALVRNLALAVVLYGSIFALVEYFQTGSVDSIAALHPARLRSRPVITPRPLNSLRPISSPDGTIMHEIEIMVAGKVAKVRLNPHANMFNRPESTVVPKDDYLGQRPHVDTVADLPLLVERCRGSLEGLEFMRNVSHCINFLAQRESEYYSLPATDLRASHQDPQKSEYALPEDHDFGLRHYPAPWAAKPASNSTLGTCAGPVIPYHVYWTGPATWRVEVFIKSYLYTQNLPCSRLWLWLDADRNPNAVEDFLKRDALFARFLPLVERGDVIVKAWHFPSRIPLPPGLDLDGGIASASSKAKAASSSTSSPDSSSSNSKHSGGAHNSDGETVVADGVVEDANGQRWLTIPAKQMTFLPVAVSDAVRFVVLHLHGGLYLDMDVLLMRDMRPLLLPHPRTGQHAFAERWGAHSHAGDYNTAIMSMTANSSLSSYLLQGGVRMGLNFHPRVLGRMAWKDARNGELLMLETATVDPVWTEFDSSRVGRCTVPCFPDYAAAFKGRRGAFKGEWSGMDAAAAAAAADTAAPEVSASADEKSEVDQSKQQQQHQQRRRRRRGRLLRRVPPRHPSSPNAAKVDVDEDGEEEAVESRDDRSRHSDGSSSTSSSSSSSSPRSPAAKSDQGVMGLGAASTPYGEIEARLRAAGAIKEYVMAEDRFPPTNRTLQHFFRGAWTYHIPKQVFFPSS